MSTHTENKQHELRPEVGHPAWAGSRVWFSLADTGWKQGGEENKGEKAGFRAGRKMRY